MNRIQHSEGAVAPGSETGIWQRHDKEGQEDLLFAYHASYSA